MLLCNIYFVLLIFVFPKSMCITDIERELIQRYNDDRTKCGKHGKTTPAYECSGIMIRGVNNKNKLKHAWSLKSSNHKRESFSVAFLRKDTRFDGFPSEYHSGFIIYPHSKTPKKRNTYKVYCAFPVDGHTDGRAGHGCGRSRDDSSRSGTSRHCDKQGIRSFKKWVSHYDKIRRSKKYFVRRQCSFDMTTRYAADDFATVIKANTHIRRSKSQYSYRNNELVFHIWNENKPEDIPIEAFFYLLDYPASYDNAKKYQDDFYKKSHGVIIPIVGIRLPTKKYREIYVMEVKRSPDGNRKRNRHHQHRG